MVKVSVSESTFVRFLALDVLLLFLYFAYVKLWLSKRGAFSIAGFLVLVWALLWWWQRPASDHDPLPKTWPGAVPTFLTRVEPYVHAYPNFTLVTGVSSNHFNSMYYLLFALMQLRAKIIVYDLGLTSEQIDEIKTVWGEIATYRRFEFERYPAYFSLDKNGGEYAWKPTIIARVLEETRADVCWLDAGTYVTSFEPLLHKLRIDSGVYGAYVGYSAGRMSEWTHPGMWAYFNESPERIAFYRSQKCVAAGLVAFRYNSLAHRQIVVPWAECAGVHQCIAPAGSDRSNHRQDQSVLTYLLAKYGVPVLGDLHAPNKDQLWTHCDVLWHTPKRCWPFALD